MSHWIDKGIDGFYLSSIEYLARRKTGSASVCLCISISTLNATHVCHFVRLDLMHYCKAFYLGLVTYHGYNS